MKLTFKNISNTILIILIISIIVLLLGNRCGNNQTSPNSNKDSLNTIIAEKTQINDYLKNENCGKLCKGYEARNGNSGACKHYGYTYEQTDRCFTLKLSDELVSQNEC